MMLLGLGAGLAFPALTAVAMSGATSEDSGLASGLVNTSLNVGGAIGLAVLATLAADRTHGLLAHSEPTAAALNAGYHVAYLAAAALVAAAIALALAVLRPRRAAPVHHGVTAGRAVAAPCSEAA